MRANLVIRRGGRSPSPSMSDGSSTPITAGALTSPFHERPDHAQQSVFLQQRGAVGHPEDGIARQVQGQIEVVSTRRSIRAHQGQPVVVALIDLDGMRGLQHPPVDTVHPAQEEGAE